MSFIKVRQNYGIILGILTFLGLFSYIVFDYEIINIIYRNGIFYLTKWILFPLQLLPIPNIFVWVFVLILALIWIFRAKKSWLMKCLDIVNVLGCLFFLFYFTWGFNYQATTLKQRIQKGKEIVEIEETQFMKFYDALERNLVEFRKQFIQDTIKQIPYTLDSLQDELLPLQKDVLDAYQFKTNLPARIKYFPKGGLLRISTAGFYFPLGGEGYIDQGLPPLDQPFVVAHELAHNFGITDEGEANYIAYKTCINADNPYIQYAALINMWKYAKRELYRRNPSLYQSRMNQISAQVKNDRHYMIREYKKYPDIFPEARDAIYHTYLKSNGVKKGMGSYSDILYLAMLEKESFNLDQ